MCMSDFYMVIRNSRTKQVYIDCADFPVRDYEEVLDCYENLKDAVRDYPNAFNIVKKRRFLCNQ